MAIFSYLGLEIVGATAGEAADPKIAVPRALRRTLFTLVLFYIGSLAIVVGIVPWNRVDLGTSPFVRVFETVGIPAAGHIMNFVVLTAALSAATCNVYFTSRLLFSLARGGYAPSGIGAPEQAVRHASCGSAWSPAWACSRSARPVPVIQEHGICVHDRRGFFWRAIHLDHDSGDAPGISASRRTGEERDFAFCAARAVEFHVWSDRFDRRLDFHLVGSQLSHCASCRTTLAHFHHVVLSGLEKSEPGWACHASGIDPRWPLIPDLV